MTANLGEQKSLYKGEHLLFLVGFCDGAPEFEFACNHESEYFWWPEDFDGVRRRRDECWLWSWWEGIGIELMADIRFTNGVTFPLAVTLSGDWDNENGGTLVPDVMVYEAVYLG